MKPSKSPASNLKYLRQSLHLTVPQVVEKAVPIFLWVTLIPVTSVSLIYLAITNNYVTTERLATLIAVAVIGVLVLSKSMLAFLICIAIYEAKGQKAVTAIRSAVHDFKR